MDLYQRSSYYFHLPEELIAAFPLESRADARLLVVRKGARSIEHLHIRDLPEILPARSVLVANNTKVFRARLKGGRNGFTGKIEFFLLKKIAPALWQGLIRSSAKVAAGFQFWVGDDHLHIQAEVLAREDTNAGTIFTVQLSRDPVDAGLGEVPLPPYIVAKREDEEAEKAEQAPRAEDDDSFLKDLVTLPESHATDQAKELETYNTVFAKHEGSVAAPTAGRHFTPELIEKLRARGMSWEEVTLHVGLGTFKPVMAEDVRQHTMHGETSFVSEEVAEHLMQAKREGRPIIAVGTTSTRTLEGRAKRISGSAETENSPAVPIDLPAGEEEINLFIHPGSNHDWKMVDGMLTNFHLPESTLLMMVGSFVGDLGFVKEIYETAIREKYRFYSYGDAMLILP